MSDVSGENSKDRRHRGLALFMADILSQLDVGFSLEVNSLYPDFGAAIVKLMTQLLKSNDKENQKNAVQVRNILSFNKGHGSTSCMRITRS